MARAVWMNSRVLGWLCVVGSTIGMADGVRLIATGHLDIPGFRDVGGTLSAIAGMFWVMGILCVCLGLIALRATGDRPIFRWLSWLPVVGSAASILGYVLYLAGVPSRQNIPGIAGQLLTYLGVLVVAVLVLVARKWSGWRAFTPLLVVIAIPIGAILVGITKLDGVFIVVNTAASVILGYAVASDARSANLQQAIGGKT
jgi:hypothetical protein